MTTQIRNLTIDGYDLWSELTDSLTGVDEMRAELARRADEGDEIASLHRDMFGPWEEEMASERCGNCIYWSKSGDCLAYQVNMVTEEEESPNAGLPMPKDGHCGAWYETEEEDLDDWCFDQPDPWRPLSLY